MIRTIIEIKSETCTGCGLCVNACHEQAIGLIDGKAVLLRDDYCDGLGNCLPACPTGSIRFTEREADPYDRAAVSVHKDRLAQAETNHQWPVQARLVSPMAPYLQDADILLTADCVPFVMRDFRGAFPFTYTTLAACPKLDQTDYRVRLKELFAAQKPKAVTVAVVDIPCCNGLWHAAKEWCRDEAREGLEIELKKVTVSVDGRILPAAP